MATRAFVESATAQDVHVTGQRILATIVDGLVCGILIAVLDTLFGTSSKEVVYAVYSVLVVLYYVLLEGYLGQTLGKMLVGIKVVREDNGEVPGLRAAAIRTLLRLIDGILSYLVAFVAVLVSAKRQRLGDIAAHTLVVHKQRVQNVPP